MQSININNNHKWSKQPMWKKRINGAWCYFLMIFVALWNPIIADMAMYKNLKSQFIDD